MTLQAFQRALCDLVASPRMCAALRDDPASVLANYELSEREQRRLVEAVWQQGMSTNCSLYRSNRITPIYTLLHSTCVVLGDDFPAVVDRFWESKEFEDGQYLSEIEKFARFVERLIEAGEIDGTFLSEVLDFEIAANALLFSPRRRTLAELERRCPGDAETLYELHPLVRIVAFRHEPTIVLQALAADEAPDGSVPEGSFFVALSTISEKLEVIPVAPSIGRRLVSGEHRFAADTAPDLVRAGLLVPAGNLAT